MLHKISGKKPDGRHLILYTSQDAPHYDWDNPHQVLRPDDFKPPQIRYNVHRGAWQSYAPSRQNRPFLPPAHYCPLCPGDPQSQVPSEFSPHCSPFEVAVVENLFPALSHHHETGLCEVVIYSQQHHVKFYELSQGQIENLVFVWQERSLELSQIPYVKHVYIFENKGEEVGVTLHHPHGQIYAYSHIPPYLQLELHAAKEHYASHKECLTCGINQREQSPATASRVVMETEHLLAFVPEAAQYPYEIHVSTKQHTPRIQDLDASERTQLARILKKLTRVYDELFQKPMPYMMVHHQCPVSDQWDHAYHWHMEFYPFLRTPTKLKYLAGSESGAGYFINDSLPEEKALELQTLFSQMKE